MSNFKAGDRFKVISDHLSFVDVNIGDIVVLSKIEGDNCHLFYHQKTKSHVALFFHDVEIIDGSEYESSNRYKLKQAIKETGISSRKLSHFAVGNESYFYNYTGKARFDKKGDITEDRLNSLLTTLAFAERELLGIGAKTVDENNVPVVEKSIDESVAEAKAALNTFSDNTQKTIELQKKYFDSAKKRIQQKKDSKVRNFLIVFLVFVVILSIYFLTR